MINIGYRFITKPEVKELDNYLNNSNPRIRDLVKKAVKQFKFLIILLSSATFALGFVSSMLLDASNTLFTLFQG